MKTIQYLQEIFIDVRVANISQDLRVGIEWLKKDIDRYTKKAKDTNWSMKITHTVIYVVFMMRNVKIFSPKYKKYGPLSVSSIWNSSHKPFLSAGGHKRSNKPLVHWIWLSIEEFLHYSDLLFLFFIVQTIILTRIALQPIVMLLLLARSKQSVARSSNANAFIFRRNVINKFPWLLKEQRIRKRAKPLNNNLYNYIN